MFGTLGWVDKLKMACEEYSIQTGPKELVNLKRTLERIETIRRWAKEDGVDLSPEKPGPASSSSQSPSNRYNEKEE